MLKSFTLKNFKSFKEATLHLTPTVTFLIGANGSGKSNALEGLRFISWLGEGKTFEEIEKMLANKFSPIRGTMGDLYRKGTDLLTIGFDFEKNENKFVFSDEIVTSVFEKHDKELPRFSVCSEQLYDERKKKNLFGFDLREFEEDSSVYTLNSGSKISLVLYTLRSIMGGIVFFGNVSFQKHTRGSSKNAKFSEKISDKENAKDAFIQFFSNVCFFDFKPIVMRDYVPQRGYIQLNEDGSNLSEVLQNLCKDDNIKTKIIEVICSLPEQNIKNINFIETEDHDVRLSLIEQLSTGEQKISARLLSDGTLRALAIATTLYSAQEGSLLVIEEVDNGIHPSRIKHLVDKMYEIAAERKIQILVTTHDPAMMDAIPQQEIGNVLCCYRDKEDGSSKIVRLSDSPQYMDVLFNGRLGNQVVSREFEENIKKTSEERKTEHEAWVKQYEKEQDEYDKALKKALGEK